MRTLTDAERAVISELVEAAQVCGGSTNEGVQMLGALLAERAAKIIRHTANPYTWPDQDLDAFAATWNVDEPAAFSGEHESTVTKR